MFPKKAIGFWALMALALLAIPSCRQGNPTPSGTQGNLPDYVMAAGPEVQEAYIYALERPEVLQRVPCYCGCVEKGHRHNLDCFVRSAGSGRAVVFEPMGAS